MSNPVDKLGSASLRIAQVAAARAMMLALMPAIALGALGFSLAAIGHFIWEHWGYVLTLERMTRLSDALLLGAELSLATGVALSMRTYYRKRDFVNAAGEVDEIIRAHQEILSFATLSDPAASPSVKARHTPLFPILWRRAMTLLEHFEPRRAFPFALGKPLARSSMFAAGISLLAMIATLGLVRAPTRLEAQAMKLSTMAREIEEKGTLPSDIALAKAAREAAEALENPKLPPEEKVKRLQEVMREIAANSGDGNQPGNQKSEGSATAGQNAKGEGKGEGEGSGGSGTAGVGSGKNGKNEGSGQGDGGKGENATVELQNEIAKAQAQVEKENSTNPNSASKAGGDHEKSPEGGANPNEKGKGNQPDPKQPGNVPKPGTEGQQNLSSPAGTQQSNKDSGSNQGEKPMGTAPPGTYQRFLKPGEKGGSLDIHDARYVMFRLPNATPIGSGGTAVLDSSRTKASTPYVNAPLRETSEDAPPDERQLVPPRYRDLIH